MAAKQNPPSSSLQKGFGDVKDIEKSLNQDQEDSKPAQSDSDEQPKDIAKVSDSSILTEVSLEKEQLITIEEFCDLKSVSKTDRFTIKKKWSHLSPQSMEKWLQLLQPHFNVN